MKTGLRMAIGIFVLASATAAAAAPACPLDDQFSETFDRLAGWQDILAYQQKFFPPCADEGAYAQAHSEWVARTLAAQWGQTGELASILRASPPFRQFFFRHLNAQGGKGQLQTILGFATIRCPRQEARLCAEIRQAAGRALEQLQ